MAADQAFRAFAQVAEYPGLGLITRRSRVQIPPPLPKALVSDLLTRAAPSCRVFYRDWVRPASGLEAGPDDVHQPAPSPAMFIRWVQFDKGQGVSVDLPFIETVTRSRIAFVELDLVALHRDASR
jgi:hypothetical protein